MRGRNAEPRRRGFSLAELLVAMTIAGLLAAVLLGLLIAQLRLARNAAQRAFTNEALRTASVVIDGELRRNVAEDVRALQRDSLALRAVRGVALPCAALAGATLVRWRGDRIPDARKDSVLAVMPGRTVAAAITDVRFATGAACATAAGEVLLQMRTTHDSLDAPALIVFEPGRYFLTRKALRYRLGAEGRQPLTAEAFAHPGTGFLPGGPASVRFELTVPAGRSALRSAWFAPVQPR